jgi:hypothetical protein
MFHSNRRGDNRGLGLQGDEGMGVGAFGSETLKEETTWETRAYVEG